MKKLVKIVGSTIIVLAAVLLLLSVTGFEPKGCPPTDRSFTCRMPGLWLKGEPVTTPVTDWSFTDNIPQIKIQTQTPFLLPHSVTIWCAVYNGNLYVTSYRGREWVENIIRDPHVRLKIADKVFDRTLSLVDDPGEKAGVLQAKGKKYPQWKVPPVSAATVFRVNPA
jgi:ribosomal protein S19